MELSEEYRKKLHKLSGILNEHSLTTFDNLPENLKMTSDQEISLGLLGDWALKDSKTIFTFIKKNSSNVIVIALDNSSALINTNLHWLGVTTSGQIFTIDNDEIENESDFIAWAESLKKDTEPPLLNL